ncbi:thioredoxin-disulfide reductase [Chloroflexota bacterium]
MHKKYDVIIIGGGPAGLSAGVYTSRDRLGSLLIEKGFTGGNMNNAGSIDNYPGFPQGISGAELAGLMRQQAEKYGLEINSAEVASIETADDKKIIKTSDGDFSAGALIIAGGSDRINLNVPGEKEFIGKGVSYCGTCDAPFFAGKKVAVVGGGNSAVYEALHLSEFATKVYLIHRRDSLRATTIVQEKAFAEAKIEFVLNSVVKTIEGDNVVRKISLQNKNSGDFSTLDVSGVFISIGLKPNTDYLKGILELDKQGHIITDCQMKTQIAGILAAGDIRSGSIRQVVSASGDGAVAAISAKNFLSA